MMTIVVDTRNASQNFVQQFLKPVLASVHTQNPGNEILVVTDWRSPEGALVSDVISTFRFGRSFLFPAWRQKARLMQLIRQKNASVFINANNKSFLPQLLPPILMVNDETLLPLAQKQTGIAKRNRMNVSKRLTPLVQQSATILVESYFGKKQLGSLFNLARHNVMVTGLPAAGEYRPLQMHEKEAIKEKVTGGREYFLAFSEGGDHAAIITVLKAFSLFKNRQQSHMKLLLLPGKDGFGSGFQQKFDSYKFRHDVQLIHEEGAGPHLWELTGAAYAVIMMTEGSGFSLSRLNTLTAGVPLITNVPEQEPGDDAVLTATENGVEAIAGHMKMLYKDENLRADLITRGKDSVEAFTADKIAGRLWDCITQIVPGHSPTFAFQQKKVSG